MKKKILDLPAAEQHKIRMRMYKGTMTQYIIYDTIYFDEDEYKNWKPRKSGRKPKGKNSVYVDNNK